MVGLELEIDFVVDFVVDLVVDLVVVDLSLYLADEFCKGEFLGSISGFLRMMLGKKKQDLINDLLADGLKRLDISFPKL